MLKYRPTARRDDGPKIFTGHPADFKLWEFKTSMKAQLATAEESKAPKYAQEVLASLGGEALQLAQDLGVKKLCAKDGIDELIKEMKKLTFPTFKQEASALYMLLDTKKADYSVDKHHRMSLWHHISSVGLSGGSSCKSMILR